MNADLTVALTAELTAELSADHTADLYTAFARGLRAPGQPVPAAVQTWNGSAPASRYGVYRNNVASSLVAALADGFPVVAQLVGEDFFRAMAQAYIAQHPPTNPVLVFWGDSFAGFVAAFAPAASLLYLADVARLERLRVQVFHAADSTPLDPAALAAPLAQPASLPGLGVQLRPSVQALVSPWPVCSLWAAHQGDDQSETDVQLPDWPGMPGEAALVLRTGAGWLAQVAVLPVPPATARFVLALQAGQKLQEAAASADSGADPRLDLAFSLGLLIHHQAILAWRPPETA